MFNIGDIIKVPLYLKGGRAVYNTAYNHYLVIDKMRSDHLTVHLESGNLVTMGDPIGAVVVA